MNKTKKKTVGITTCLVYDLFIDLYHVVSHYISQFIVTNEENNAASDNDYVVKNSDRTLTCRAPRYTESDASEADRNKDILIIFWKSSLILFVKPTFTRQIFEFIIFNIDSIV